MYLEFDNDTLYAFDLDGVLIDSIKECFELCKMTFNGFNLDDTNAENLFNDHRGLVGPAYQYYYLMSAIERFFTDDKVIISDLFSNMKKSGANEDAKDFEEHFFRNRRMLQKKNFKKWISLNPLTPFGEYVKINQPRNMIVVTTKNKDSAKIILKHHKIFPQKVYGNEDVKKNGSKGTLLSLFLNESNFNEITFIDDSVDHLDTVKDKNINCYFADWGYGMNSNYKTYSKS